MATNFSPIYPSIYRTYVTQIATANTGLDGSGTLGSIVTGATGGSVVRKVWVKATGATTAGMIRFFLFDASNNRLIHEMSVSAITPSGTVVSFVDDWDPGDTTQDGLFGLASGWILKASTHNAETFNVWAEVEEYS